MPRRPSIRLPKKNDRTLRLDYDLRRRYGISLEQYQLLVAAQHGKCAICERPPASPERLTVDHCHETDRIRGLLCSSCNSGIGMFDEDHQRFARAAAYLADPPTRLTAPHLCNPVQQLVLAEDG